MNPMWYLAGILLCGLCFILWAMLKTAQKEDIAMGVTPALVSNKGLSPYSAKPEDPERSRIADKCFRSSKYCFWNDIFHYGGSRDVQYMSPEVCLYNLYRDKHPVIREEDRDVDADELMETLMTDYCFMAWNLDETDRSVFAVAVDELEFLKHCTEDPPDDYGGYKFLGFSWIDEDSTFLYKNRVDISDDGCVAMQLAISEDWHDFGFQLLNMDADAFEAAVRNFNDGREE